MRRIFIAAIATLTVIVAIIWWRRPSEAPKAAPAAASMRRSGFGAPLPARPSRIAALAADVKPDSISPIANDLGTPGGSIQRDLQILNDVLVAWRTNFPHEGNPVGENDEITAALAGDNPLHFAFIAPTHPAINAEGQLCDRWGTPFRFHQLSGTDMELRSAGPDRRFGTADDVQFAAGRNLP